MQFGRVVNSAERPSQEKKIDGVETGSAMPWLMLETGADNMEACSEAVTCCLWRAVAAGCRLMVPLGSAS